MLSTHKCGGGCVEDEVGSIHGGKTSMDALGSSSLSYLVKKMKKKKKRKFVGSVFWWERRE